MRYCKYIATARFHEEGTPLEETKMEFFTCDDFFQLAGWTRDKVEAGWGVEIQKPKIVPAPHVSKFTNSFVEGREAWASGVKMSECPYLMTSVDEMLWTSGWMLARLEG
jgi:hypothetical protein